VWDVAEDPHKSLGGLPGKALSGHDMTKRLEGKVALVTGAATSIGRATAERLAQERATVVAGIAEEGQRPNVAPFHGIVLDVRSEEDWVRAIVCAEETHGGLDILVNNAAIHRPDGIAETTRNIGTR
jgi:3-oxoacyl-[acyl-carrier protein] reductase